MSFIIKNLNKTVTVSKANLELVDAPFDPTKHERRRAFGIIIYPEANGEFQHFYLKHVKRQKIYRDDQASVLVKGVSNEPEEILSELEARTALDLALLSAKLTEKKQVEVDVPQFLEKTLVAVRVFDFVDGRFLSPPSNRAFVFRDAVKAPKNPRRLLAFLSGKILDSEIQQVLRKLEETKRSDKI